MLIIQSFSIRPPTTPACLACFVTGATQIPLGRQCLVQQSTRPALVVM
jgi:hypothetical protein